MDLGTLTVQGTQATFVSADHGTVVLHALMWYVRTILRGPLDTVWCVKWSIREGGAYIKKICVEDSDNDMEECPGCWQ
jgi:hypothetical protein